MDKKAAISESQRGSDLNPRQQRTRERQGIADPVGFFDDAQTVRVSDEDAERERLHLISSCQIQTSQLGLIELISLRIHRSVTNFLTSGREVVMPFAESCAAIRHNIRNFDVGYGPFCLVGNRYG